LNVTITPNTDGTFSVTPDPDFNGQINLTFDVNDGTTSVASTMTLNVEAVNDAVVAVDDSAQTNEDTPIVIDALANDVDVDNDTLHIASVVSPVMHNGVEVGTAEIVSTDPVTIRGVGTCI
jgi:hypothetical protein